jgi:ATP synthase protein I
LSITLNNSLIAAGKKLVKQQLLFALVVAFACTITIYFFWGILYAYSALLGAAIAIIPNTIFGKRAFKYSGARQSQQVVDSFYKGEKIKILLTAILFALSFRFFPIVPVPLFSVFSLVVILSLLTPVLFKH